jgi:SAM-dependent methyltransferase
MTDSQGPQSVNGRGTPSVTPPQSQAGGLIPPGADDRPLDADAARLPPRYSDPWRGPFFDRVRPTLRPGMSILDVGSGRRPTIPAAWRPARTTYVGLDISGSELAAAAPGAYAETWVGDVGARLPSLVGQFDLIVSWQVLEHVENLAQSLANMHSYLRAGGRMVAMLSGSYALFAVMARVMPHPLRVAAMARALDSDPVTKFKTHYDRCNFSAMDAILAGWARHEILPLYRGASYFGFWRPLERGYLAYEDWLVNTGRKNLATHYLIVGDAG